jgi:hypothetical protein
MWISKFYNCNNFLTKNNFLISQKTIFYITIFLIENNNNNNNSNILELFCGLHYCVLKLVLASYCLSDLFGSYY